MRVVIADGCNVRSFVAVLGTTWQMNFLCSWNGRFERNGGFEGSITELEQVLSAVFRRTEAINEASKCIITTLQTNELNHKQGTLTKKQVIKVDRWERSRPESRRSLDDFDGSRH